MNVDVAAVLAGLKDFQRRTVNHVCEQLFGAGSEERSGRFLVADETGLGKSVVARGVIARLVEHLDGLGADQVNVVYLCSNQDLARQNLRRLNVTGDEHLAVSSRLSLLARERARLDGLGLQGERRFNLVSLTPGTSFSEGGIRQGSAPERAMLVLIADELWNEDAAERWATRVLLRGMVSSAERFDEHYVQPLAEQLAGPPDAEILRQLTHLLGDTGIVEQFLRLRDAHRDLEETPGELWHSVQQLISDLRMLLARAGVSMLKPDLIILDEFQRFKHLLDRESGEAADLADALFSHENAKVLLLSATPYKPYTAAKETEDHATDFQQTIRFLTGGNAEPSRAIASALSDYRAALSAGDTSAESASRVRAQLLEVMVRSERPPIAQREDLVEVQRIQAAPTAGDLREAVALARLGEALGRSVGVEYWKSIPYFANFLDGYQYGVRIRAAQGSGAGAAVSAALAACRGLEAGALTRFEELDLGNGPLRELADRTVGAGWWQLLWVPPTMPYTQPGAVFSPFANGSVTKQVLFSSWSATPTAVAGLLSYEADRLAAGSREILTENSAAGRRQVSPKLGYQLSSERAPSRMSTLALFWPHPELAPLGDGLRASRECGSAPSAEAFVEWVAKQLPASARHTTRLPDSYFSVPGAFPPGATSPELVRFDEGHAAEAASAVDGEADHTAERGTDGWRLHVDQARKIGESGTVEPATHPDLAHLVAFGPGNSAWRALRTVASPAVSAEVLWQAAIDLGNGLRTLFNRPETHALLGTLYGTGQPYWQSVLQYCADGNLQAVLEEYLFQLVSDSGAAEIEDAGLRPLAQRAAAALALRPARYLAHATTLEREDIALPARFALRYGDAQTDQDGAAGVRLSEVRHSFNSPFAPFVLASTSVGQEGIDFHWWSHSVVHWNLPSNPVDFEQREGRVNRYAGHVVRKNVANAHWSDVLESQDRNAWRSAFSAAEATATELGEFSPWWMYPGESRIQRVIPAYPLSRDREKYRRLTHAQTLYRLTLGQPRQEDLLELLSSRGVDPDAFPTIDLSPPG